MNDLELPHEQIVARRDFDEAVRQLLVRNGALAVGGLKSHTSLVKREWVAERLEVVTGSPRGPQFPALADWLVIAVDGGSKSVLARREQFQPLPGQTLVILDLGLGPNRGGWQGWVLRGDRESPLHGFRLVGGGYLVVERNRPQPSQDAPNDEVPALSGDSSPAAPIASPSHAFARNSDRWSRLRNCLGEEVLSKLAAMHVMLFGASRSGSLLARELAALGVGKLTLVDPDVLELHNFDALVGGDLQQIGRSKVAALAEELTRFRDDLAVTGLACTATDAPVLSRARDADLLATCVDHGTPVLLAAKLANTWNKLHLDIGAGVQRAADGLLQIAADVRLFFPHEACASCVGGIANRVEAQIDLRLPPGARPLRPRRNWQTERAGSLITINAIAVSLGVQQILDTLAGQLPHSHWTRLEYRPGKGLQVDEAAVVGRADCRLCGR